MAITVLYVHHTGIYGGASRSLFEMIRGFPPDTIQPCLVTQYGTVAQLAREAGIPAIEASGISQLDHSRFGHYRGRRWLLLLREIAYLVPTLLALCRARHRWPEIALVHVNELTLLPVIWIARKLFSCPLIVHVRSVQLTDTSGWRGRLIHRELVRAAAVVAIDETVRRSLPPQIPVNIIHNGLAVSPATRAVRPVQTLTRIGMVGNLLALKGVHNFIAAARICKDRGLHVRFVLFGGNARKTASIAGWLLRIAGFAQDIEGDLRRMAVSWGLDDIIEFNGFNADLDAVYRSIDILCFPSQLDAPGRPVFEAAFWGVPSIVAVKDPLPDTLISGETGIAIDTGSPEAIATAIAHFCSKPGEIERMGTNARQLAERNFDSRDNAFQVLQLYRRILEKSSEVSA